MQCCSTSPQGSGKHSFIKGGQLQMKDWTWSSLPLVIKNTTRADAEGISEGNCPKLCLQAFPIYLIQLYKTCRFGNGSWRSHIHVFAKFGLVGSKGGCVGGWIPFTFDPPVHSWYIILVYYIGSFKGKHWRIIDYPWTLRL